MISLGLKVVRGEAVDQRLVQNIPLTIRSFELLFAGL